MKAIVRTAYGPPDVLKLQQVEQPQLADDGVLVREEAFQCGDGCRVGRHFGGLLQPRAQGGQRGIEHGLVTPGLYYFALSKR